MSDGAPGFRRALERLHWQQVHGPRRSGSRRGQSSWQDDPWFQGEVAELSLEATSRFDLAPSLADDVAAGAARLFHRRLKRYLAECFPTWLPPRGFQAWARVLIRRDCLAAARRLAPASRESPARQLVPSSPESRRDRVHVATALDRLPKVERVLLGLFLKGLSTSQAAVLMGLSSRAARRIFWLAVEHLLDGLSTDRRAL